MPINATFDFWDLPRELRDIIYDELPTTAKRLHLKEFQKTDLWVIGHELPKTNLLLVSRQFNHEYSERKARGQRLTIEDHLLDPSETTLLKLPRRITSFPGLDFFLFAGCNGVDGQHAIGESCSVASDIQAHRLRIESWTRQMNNLRSLTVNIHLDPRKESRECDSTFVQNQRALTDLAGLERLDAWRIDFNAEEGTEFWDYSRVIGEAVATWTPGMSDISKLKDCIEDDEMEEAG